MNEHRTSDKNPHENGRTPEIISQLDPPSLLHALQEGPTDERSMMILPPLLPRTSSPWKKISAIVSLSVVLSAVITRLTCPYLGLNFLITNDVNDYRGFGLHNATTTGAIYQCESITLESIASAEMFFKHYIRPRKPVKIRFDLTNFPGWNVSQLIDPHELNLTLGSDNVDLEVVTGRGKMFGQSSEKRSMVFSQFLHHLLTAGGGSGEATKSSTIIPEDRYYLNLQRQDNSRDRALTAPLSKLSRYFTIPSFFSSLPVDAINWWYGQAGAAGSSSNLHADSSDNLYVVLQGAKRFKFYSYVCVGLARALGF